MEGEVVMRSIGRLATSGLVFCAAAWSLPPAATAKSFRVTGIVVDDRARPVAEASIGLYEEPPERFFGRQAP